MAGSLVVAIDLGGTKTALALVDDSGQISCREALPTRSFHTPERWVEAVAHWIEGIRKRFSFNEEIVGIGVGAPSGNCMHGTLDFAPNMPWEGVVPLASLLEFATGLPCVLDNDANAAAYGEWLYGAARGCRDFIVITLGTGLGSGFVCGGRMLYGYQALAGEAGHFILIPDGRPCNCGRKGCAETYCSATGFLITWKEVCLSAGREFSMKDTPKDVAALAVAGDPLALEAFRLTGEWLGLTLANCCAFSNPQKIVLSGGLSAAGEVLMKPTRQAFERHLLRVYRGHVELCFSGLPGQDAALLGAASVFFKKSV